MTRPYSSEAIDQIAVALTAAQAKFGLAEKDGVNPHFKRKYPTLASVWEACRTVLTEHGLAVVQLPFPGEPGQAKMVLRTVLMHVSGQFLASEMPMSPDPTKPQEVGSCLTYARRYALAAMLGICTADDDGEKAMAPHRGREPRPAEAPAPRSAKEQTGKPAKVREYEELVSAALDYWGYPEGEEPDSVSRNLHRELLGEAVARKLLRDPGMLDHEGVIREMRRVHAMHPSFVGSILRDEAFAKSAIRGAALSG